MNKAECPLCGNNNQCAMTQSDTDTSECWCISTHIPKEVLEKVPTQDKGQRCICKRCAQKIDKLSQEVK